MTTPMILNTMVLINRKLSSSRSIFEMTQQTDTRNAELPAAIFSINIYTSMVIKKCPAFHCQVSSLSDQVTRV